MMSFYIRLKFFLLFSLSLPVLHMHAQTNLSNGGFENWVGGFFAPGGRVGCCGSGLAVPVGWGIPEQLMLMPTNQFVYKETDSANIHSGFFSARLATNLTLYDSTGHEDGDTTWVDPGAVVCAGIVAYGGISVSGNVYQTQASSTGGPFTGTPSVLYFYIETEHEVTDTARYAYALTRWDSTAMKEDTLAVNDVDLPDNNIPGGTWVLFTDTLHYLLPGAPDTLHLIFFGGRNGDINKSGNLTWLDDVSFDGPTTGIIHLDADDAISLYPNPASDMLHIRADSYMTGCTLEIYDLMGGRVMQQPIQSGSPSYDIRALTDGVYLYRISDTDANTLSQGKISIVK